MVTAFGPDSRVSQSKHRKVLPSEKVLSDFGEGGWGWGSDPVISSDTAPPRIGEYAASMKEIRVELQKVIAAGRAFNSSESENFEAMSSGATQFPGVERNAASRFVDYSCSTEWEKSVLRIENHIRTMVLNDRGTGSEAIEVSGIKFKISFHNRTNDKSEYFPSLFDIENRYILMSRAGNDWLDCTSSQKHNLFSTLVTALQTFSESVNYESKRTVPPIFLTMVKEEDIKDSRCLDILGYQIFKRRSASIIINYSSHSQNYNLLEDGKEDFRHVDSLSKLFERQLSLQMHDFDFLQSVGDVIVQVMAESSMTIMNAPEVSSRRAVDKNFSLHHEVLHQISDLYAPLNGKKKGSQASSIVALSAVLNYPATKLTSIIDNRNYSTLVPSKQSFHCWSATAQFSSRKSNSIIPTVALSSCVRRLLALYIYRISQLSNVDAVGDRNSSIGSDSVTERSISMAAALSEKSIHLLCGMCLNDKSLENIHAEETFVSSLLEIIQEKISMKIPSTDTPQFNEIEESDTNGLAILCAESNIELLSLVAICSGSMQGFISSGNLWSKFLLILRSQWEEGSPMSGIDKSKTSRFKVDRRKLEHQMDKKMTNSESGKLDGKNVPLHENLLWSDVIKKNILLQSYDPHQIIDHTLPILAQKLRSLQFCIIVKEENVLCCPYGDKNVLQRRLPKATDAVAQKAYILDKLRPSDMMDCINDAAGNRVEDYQNGNDSEKEKFKKEKPENEEEEKGKEEEEEGDSETNLSIHTPFGDENSPEKVKKRRLKKSSNSQSSASPAVLSDSPVDRDVFCEKDIGASINSRDNFDGLVETHGGKDDNESSADIIIGSNKNDSDDNGKSHVNKNKSDSSDGKDSNNDNNDNDYDNDDDDEFQDAVCGKFEVSPAHLQYWRVEMDVVISDMKSWKASNCSGNDVSDESFKMFLDWYSGKSRGTESIVHGAQGTQARKEEMVEKKAAIPLPSEGVVQLRSRGSGSRYTDSSSSTATANSAASIGSDDFRSTNSSMGDFTGTLEKDSRNSSFNNQNKNNDNSNNDRCENSKSSSDVRCENNPLNIAIGSDCQYTESQLAVWGILWRSCSPPCPASEQKNLFSAETEAEKTLGYLGSLNPTQLASELLLSAMAYCPISLLAQVKEHVEVVIAFMRRLVPLCNTENVEKILGQNEEIRLLCVAISIVREEQHCDNVHYNESKIDYSVSQSALLSIDNVAVLIEKIEEFSLRVKALCQTLDRTFQIIEDDSMEVFVSVLPNVIYGMCATSNGCFKPCNSKEVTTA